MTDSKITNHSTRAVEARAQGARGPNSALHDVGDTKAPVMSAGIALKEVRVRNFRCLRQVDVEIDPLTVLVGQNNSGKTSFLSALSAGIGIGQRGVSSDDIFLEKGEGSAPRDRTVAIDLLIRPTNDRGDVVDVFPAGSPWLELWGNGVVQDEEGHDLVAIRTLFRWSAVKGEYLFERRFLKDWQEDPTRWEDSRPLEHFAPVSWDQVEPLALHLLDPGRDFADDLRSRSSFWSKMVTDHGLASADVEQIESALSEINRGIVERSEVFTHLQSYLREFHETLSCEQDSVAITPLPRQLRDLSRGMDVVLSTRGAPPLPLQQQGMGTRSLGAFFTFWAFITWRQRRAETGPLYPFMALEEPETHLHPQAQRALFRQIDRMPGLRIISTHSPYVCQQVPIRHLRHFSKQGEETVVRRLVVSGVSSLTLEDLRKIDRQVMNTRGDMLFARALVFFEGETEEQAIPDFAEKCWTRHPNDLGHSFVGVGGSGNYLPFLRMAESFQIPWFIFSDGQKNATEAVDGALRAISQGPLPHPRVVVIPGGKDFEEYLVAEPARELLIEAIIKQEAMQPAHERSLRSKWDALNHEAQLAKILRTLQDGKTKYGAVLGKILPVPPALKDLFGRVDTELSEARSPATGQ